MKSNLSKDDEARIEKLVEHYIRGAMELLAEEHAKLKAWLQLFWNPRLSPEENLKRAYHAVDAGWEIPK